MSSSAMDARLAENNIPMIETRKLNNVPKIVGSLVAGVTVLTGAIWGVAAHTATTGNTPPAIAPIPPVTDSPFTDVDITPVEAPKASSECVTTADPRDKHGEGIGTGFGAYHAGPNGESLFTDNEGQVWVWTKKHTWCLVEEDV